MGRWMIAEVEGENVTDRHYSLRLESVGPWEIARLEALQGPVASVQKPAIACAAEWSV